MPSPESREPVPPVPPAPNTETPARPIEATIDTLEGKYLLVGHDAVRPFRAWALIGLTAVLALGAILIANQSGDFEPDSWMSSGAELLRRLINIS